MRLSDAFRNPGMFVKVRFIYPCGLPKSDLYSVWKSAEAVKLRFVFLQRPVEVTRGTQTEHGKEEDKRLAVAAFVKRSVQHGS